MNYLTCTRRKTMLALTLALLTLTISFAGWRAQAGRGASDRQPTVRAALLPHGARLAPVAAVPLLASNIVVTSTADGTLMALNGNGTCDLREAIAAANTNLAVGECAAGMVGADTITFAVTGTIVLTAGELGISEALNITGPGANGLTISGNNASRVFNIAAGSLDVTFSALSIANGRVSGTSALGGGILNSSTGTLNIINSTLAGNSVSASGSTVNFGEGGGISNDLVGTVNITNSTFSGNSASASGGTNNAGFGGGINNFGTVNLTSSTLAGNSASASGGVNFGAGGGISNDLVSTVNAKNTIIARNTVSGSPTFGPDVRGAFTSQGYNLIGDNSDSSGFTKGVNNDQVGTAAMPIDPLLAPLGNYGGPTQTRPPLPGSPAIDKGNSFTLTTDQRGFPRPQDNPAIANATGGDGADIGAVELFVDSGAMSMIQLTVDPAANPTGAAQELINALILANDDPAATTIKLVCGTYTLTQRGDPNNYYGFNGLPAITSNVTIQGNGAVIERSSAMGTPLFRLFAVAAQDPTTGAALTTPGSLTLDQVTLRGGEAYGGYGTNGGGGGAGLGGAIYNQGTLIVTNSALTANVAEGGASGINPLRPHGGGGGLGGSGSGGFGSNGAGGGFGGNGGTGISSTGGEGGGRTANGNNSGSGGSPEGGDGGSGSGNGGAGGFGGGGGGSGSEGSFGGNGGVGGGGGGSGNKGGAGGFGGGGGGGGTGNGGAGGFGGGGGGGAGTGGFGSGNGGGFEGGGGAGLGGAIFNDGGALTVHNSTISGNEAEGGASTMGSPGQGLGGGIFSRNGSVTLKHATLNNNAVTDGAGATVANGGGSLYLLGDGQVVRVGDTTSVRFDVANSIFANTPNAASDAFVNMINGGSLLRGAYNNNNLVEVNGSTAGTDVNDLPDVTVTTDPLLGALTLPNCATGGCRTPVHPITNTSPAYNAAGMNSLATDQCGTLRPQGVSSDIGAYEVIVPFVPPGLGVSLTDPIVCNGVGGIVLVTAQLTNLNAVMANSSFSAMLPPELSAISGTCTASTGTCQIVNPGQVTWMGTLTANQTVTIQYQALVANGTPPGTVLCVNSTGTVAGLNTMVQACGTTNCPPNNLNNPPTNVGVSGQRAGSVLVYPYYTAKSASKSDTRLTLSNIGAQEAIVHLFFIDGTSCQQADFFVCLTANASFSFKASEYDPETTGWLLAVAVDKQGHPVNNNVLIGNAFVQDGLYVDNYGAESFWAKSANVAVLTNNTAQLLFNDIGYEAVPDQFAVELQSPLDAPGQKLVTVGLLGDLTTGQLSGGAQVGVGLIFNGNEKPSGSFGALLTGNCQASTTIGTATPRVPGGMATMIPSSQVGTMRFNVGASVGLLLTPRGAANRWNGIRALHKTHTTFTTITIPVLVPVC